MQVLVYSNKRFSHTYVRSFVSVFDSFLDSLGGVRWGVKVIVWHLIQKIQPYRRDDYCRLPDFAGAVIWRYLEYSEEEEASFTSTYTCVHLRNHMSSLGPSTAKAYRYGMKEQGNNSLCNIMTILFEAALLNSW